MNPKEKNRTWRSLLIPFSIGVLILCAAFYSLIFGNTDKIRVQGIFMGMLGGLLLYFAGNKIVAIRKFLKKQEEELLNENL